MVVAAFFVTFAGLLALLTVPVCARPAPALSPRLERYVRDARNHYRPDGDVRP